MDEDQRLRRIRKERTRTRKIKILLSMGISALIAGGVLIMAVMTKEPTYFQLFFNVYFSGIATMFLIDNLWGED